MMRVALDKAGGRKLVGFFCCLMVGGVLIYFERLDTIAATFIAALYGALVGGNAARHIAVAVTSFGAHKYSNGEPRETDDGSQ